MFPDYSGFNGVGGAGGMGSPPRVPQQHQAVDPRNPMGGGQQQHAWTGGSPFGPGAGQQQQTWVGGGSPWGPGGGQQQQAWTPPGGGPAAGSGVPADPRYPRDPRGGRDPRDVPLRGFGMSQTGGALVLGGVALLTIAVTVGAGAYLGYKIAPKSTDRKWAYATTGGVAGGLMPGIWPVVMLAALWGGPKIEALVDGDGGGKSKGDD